MKLIDLVIKENYPKHKKEGIKYLKKLITNKDCPSFYGYININNTSFCKKEDCKKCWEREV